MITSLVQSYIGWGSIVFGSSKLFHINKLESAQNKAFRNLLVVKFNSHTLEHYNRLGILKASDLIDYFRSQFIYKFRREFLPLNFSKHLKYSYEMGDRSHREDCLNLHVSTTSGQGNELFPLPEIIKCWNRLDYHIKTAQSVKVFKKEVKEQMCLRYLEYPCALYNCYACKQSHNISYN